MAGFELRRVFEFLYFSFTLTVNPHSDHILLLRCKFLTTIYIYLSDCFSRNLRSIMYNPANHLQNATMRRALYFNNTCFNNIYYLKVLHVYTNLHFRIAGYACQYFKCVVQPYISVNTHTLYLCVSCISNICTADKYSVIVCYGMYILQ